MQRKLLIFLLAVFLTGCAAAITRYGYNLQDIPQKDVYLDCTIPIKKNFQYNKDEVEILGSIKSGDTGFSVKCGEAYVLKQFQQEACALGVDLINIIEERRFDILSTCYRAKAEFLRFTDRGKVKDLASDPLYVR